MRIYATVFIFVFLTFQTSAQTDEGLKLIKLHNTLHLTRVNSDSIAGYQIYVLLQNTDTNLLVSNINLNGANIIQLKTLAEFYTLNAIYQRRCGNSTDLEYFAKARLFVQHCDKEFFLLKDSIVLKALDNDCGINAETVYALDQYLQKTAYATRGIKIDVAPVYNSMPQFPFPPPRCSDYYVLPENFYKDFFTIGDLNSKLTKCLDQNGYQVKKYYSIPKGYAVVTQLEQLDERGEPKNIPYRWDTRLNPLENFSIYSYIRALFFAEKGYYRFLVFMVSAANPQEWDSKKITRSQLPEGAAMLDKFVSKIKYTDDYKVYVMIYEYEHVETEDAPTLLIPGKFSGANFMNSKLWKNLTY